MNILIKIAHDLRTSKKIPSHLYALTPTFFLPLYLPIHVLLEDNGRKVLTGGIYQ